MNVFWIACCSIMLWSDPLSLSHLVQMDWSSLGLLYWWLQMWQQCPFHLVCVCTPVCLCVTVIEVLICVSSKYTHTVTWPLSLHQTCPSSSFPFCLSLSHTRIDYIYSPSNDLYDVYLCVFEWSHLYLQGKAQWQEKRRFEGFVLMPLHCALDIASCPWCIYAVRNSYNHSSVNVRILCLSLCKLHMGSCRSAPLWVEDFLNVEVLLDYYISWSIWGYCSFKITGYRQSSPLNMQGFITYMHHRA